MNIQDWLPLGLTDLISLLSKDSQETSPGPQFKSINSSALSLVYSSIFTPIHDYWKNHSFDYTDLCIIVQPLEQFHEALNNSIEQMRKLRSRVMRWLEKTCSSSWKEGNGSWQNDPGVIPCSSLLNCSAEFASLLGDPCLELWKGGVSALKPLAPTRLRFFPQMHLENLH